MAKHDIEVVVSAKNSTQKGLAGAASSVRNFTKAVRLQLSTILGPVAVVTAALVALKKGFDFLADAADKGARAMREMASQRAQSEIRAVDDAVRNLSRRYKMLNDEAAAATEVMSAQKKAARELEKATLDLAKAKDLELAATLGGDAVDAVNKEYDIKQKILQAEQAIADAQDKKTQLEQEAQRAQEQSSKLLKQEQRFRETALRRQSDSLELERQANQMADSFLGRIKPEKVQALDEAVKTAREEADQAFDKAREIADQRAKLELDAQKKINLAREAGTEIEAKRKAREAMLDQDFIDKKLQYEKDAASAVRALKDEEDRQARAMANDRLKEIDEQLRKSKELAKKRIKDILAEQEAEKQANKEREKEEKKARRLERRASTGARLNRKDQEFLDAMRLRLAAAGGAAGLKAEAAGIKGGQAAKDFEKQNEILRDLRKSFEDNNKKLIQLLLMR